MSTAYRAASGLVHTLQTAGRRPWRSMMTMRGRDATLESARRSCVVVAPHPDDETLGCGAAIARKVAAGSPVWILIATDGRHSHKSRLISPATLGGIRADEARAACRTLGVPEDRFRQLGWEDSRLAEREEELTEVIRTVVGNVRPDEILVTSARDWHPDHQAANRAARAALAGHPRATASLREYPIWHWAEGPWQRHGPRPLAQRLWDVGRDPWASLHGGRPELVATGEFLDRKREALGCYRSQLENLTGEATWAVFDKQFLDAFLRRYELFLVAG